MEYEIAKIENLSTYIKSFRYNEITKINDLSSEEDKREFDRSFGRLLKLKKVVRIKYETNECSYLMDFNSAKDLSGIELKGLKKKIYFIDSE